MANIIIEEVITKKTMIRCSWKQRAMIEEELNKNKRYNQVSFFSDAIDKDYMVGSTNSNEYVGPVIWIISEDIKKHDELVKIITGLLIDSGDTVQKEIKRIYKKANLY